MLIHVAEMAAKGGVTSRNVTFGMSNDVIIYELIDKWTCTVTVTSTKYK